MDIEKLKQRLLEEAKTLANNFDSYCNHSECSNCELCTDKRDCIETIIFIALCNGSAISTNNQSKFINIHKMLIELFPNFYEYITK